MEYISFKIEVRLFASCAGEEAVVLGILVKKTGPEILVHFIGWARDARPDCCVNIIAPRTEAFHRLDRPVGYPGNRAAPARMRGTYDPRFFIGKQHWRAIGGENAEQDPGSIGDEAIGTRALLLRPSSLGKDDLGGMDLVNRRELGPRQNCFDRKGAVPGNRFAIIIAAKSYIEPCALAFGDSAAARKKAVRQLPQRGRSNDFYVAQRFFRMMMSSST